MGKSVNETFPEAFHKLSQFQVSTTFLSSYCIQHDETVEHLFSNCNEVISLGAEIKFYFVNDIKLIALCPQIAILGYTNTYHRYFITQNLILLTFKFYVYKPRGSADLRFSASFHELVKIKNLEKGAALRNRRKLDVYEKKWSFVENDLQSK